MVEAMCEQSPDFFRKFKKNFQVLYLLFIILPELVFSPANDQFN